jgi:hypothetical protein
LSHAVLPAQGNTPFLLCGEAVSHNFGCVVQLPDDDQVSDARGIANRRNWTKCARAGLERSGRSAVVTFSQHFASGGTDAGYR